MVVELTVVATRRGAHMERPWAEPTGWLWSE